MSEPAPYTEFRHPQLGFTIQLAEDSELVPDAPLVALLALEPPGRAAFRASLAVTVEELSEPIDLEHYTDASLEMQHDILEAMHLLDRCTDAVGGRPATRTLCHHNADGIAVTLEQWRILDDGRAYSVSASVGSLDYDLLADSLAAMAESLQLAPAA